VRRAPAPRGAMRGAIPYPCPGHSLDGIDTLQRLERKPGFRMGNFCNAAALRFLAFFALALGIAMPAQARLQCVPYARAESGIDIHGNAKTWWAQADGRYARGQEPKVGAVLNFRPTGAMPQGHVAVVSKIIDARTIELDHANWSRPGMIEHDALAVDVSEKGDWSVVRVWYAPSGSLGERENPTFGFIYGDAETAPVLAQGSGGSGELATARTVAFAAPLGTGAQGL